MLTVRFFAVLKEKVGGEEFSLPLSGVRVSDVIKSLEESVPGLTDILSDFKAMVAVNHEMAGLSTVVKDGDEIAFIPPFSGGSEGLVRVQTADFSVDEEIRRVKRSSSRIGGIATFLGTARDLSKGKDISRLTFEHYPGMAEKKLNEIRERAIKDFGIIEMCIVHRVGKIDIGENIVLIVAASPHRKEAFRACEFAIDELKRITPIWKKETTTSGEEWVEEHP